MFQKSCIMSKQKSHKLVSLCLRWRCHFGTWWLQAQGLAQKGSCSFGGPIRGFAWSPKNQGKQEFKAQSKLSIAVSASWNSATFLLRTFCKAISGVCTSSLFCYASTVSFNRLFGCRKCRPVVTFKEQIFWSLDLLQESLGLETYEHSVWICPYEWCMQTIKVNIWYEYNLFNSV